MPNLHDGTIDSDPFLMVGGIGVIDCREEGQFLALTAVFSDKAEILHAAAHSALRDFNRNLASARQKPSYGSQPNPFNRILSPLQWTAWRMSYAFWRKNFHSLGASLERVNSLPWVHLPPGAVDWSPRGPN